MSPVVVAAVARANATLAARTCARLNLQTAIVTLARSQGYDARPSGAYVVITRRGEVGSYTVETLTQARHALGME